jgi:hypothetical protein
MTKNKPNGKHPWAKNTTALCLSSDRQYLFCFAAVFIIMATEIIKLIEEFAKCNQSLEKMNAQLGQKKDGAEFRQKLSQQRESAKVYP